MADVVVIAAGGTGGHIYPGLAVAQALKEIHPDIEVHFVGTARGLENKIVPSAGYPLHKLPVGMLNKSAGIKEILKTLVRLPLAFWRSWQLLRILKPRFLLGVGGYASGPILFVGALTGYKSFIWEPNAMPGLANRILARFVREAFVVFDGARKLLKARKVLQVGMPVRKSIELMSEKPVHFESHQPFRLFVFGGSQGARALNETLVQAIKEDPEWLKKVEVIHQTGSTDYERIRGEYEKLGLGKSSPLQVLEYVHDMEAKYEWADLVVCRSGVGSLSELAAVGKAALFVPFPFAADNHQQKNAEELVQAGAAEMILQKDLTPSIFRQKVLNLCSQPEHLRNMAEKVRQFHHPHSALDLSKMLLEKSQ